jgi:hypothetical protein
MRDPGWIKISIRDKHPGSATLYYTGRYLITALIYLSWGATFYDIEDLLAVQCCSDGLTSFVYLFPTNPHPNCVFILTIGELG